MLKTAQHVLAVEPDYAAMQGLKVGVIGPHAAAGGADFEARTFIPNEIWAGGNTTRCISGAGVL